VLGTPVLTPLCIDLTEGWNIISFPCLMNSRDAMVVFQTLIDEGRLVKVINESGQSLYRLLGTWINFIGNMNPGEGYYVKVNSDCQVCIDCGGAALPKAKIEDVAISAKPEHFAPQQVGNPYQPMHIYLTGVSLNGAPLEPGDEVAVFDDKRCVGVAVCSDNVTRDKPLAVIASHDDGSGNGFVEGHSMSFRVWKKASSAELSLQPEAISYLDPVKGAESAPVTFEALGTAAVNIDLTPAAEENVIPASYRLEQNYPNPFNPVTRISYAIPVAAQLRLEIFDLNGHLVTTLFDGNQTAGYHSIEWDGTNSRGERVASGVYFYKLTSSDYTMTKTMVFTK
jgi:hypothetical protein